MALASLQPRRQRHLHRCRCDAAGKPAGAAGAWGAREGGSAVMTGLDRSRPAWPRFPLVALFCLVAGPTLVACADFKRAVGIERTSPDEFAVESRAPLTMPPDYDLRPPQPGAPRPQEQSTADKAKQALDTAGPGEPGK